MKKATLLLMAFSIQAMLMAQESSTVNQQAVHQSVVQLFDALSNRDSVSLKAICTADIALYEYGQVWNIDTLILKAITLNQATDFNRINHFNFINTTVDKNTAWATYQLQSEITRDGKQSSVEWMETVIVVKVKKQWKVKLLHSTLIKRT